MMQSATCSNLPFQAIHHSHANFPCPHNQAQAPLHSTCHPALRIRRTIAPPKKPKKAQRPPSASASHRGYPRQAHKEGQRDPQTALCPPSSRPRRPIRSSEGERRRCRQTQQKKIPSLPEKSPSPPSPPTPHAPSRDTRIIHAGRWARKKSSHHPWAGQPGPCPFARWGSEPRSRAHNSGRLPSRGPCAMDAPLPFHPWLSLSAEALAATQTHESRRR